MFPEKIEVVIFDLGNVLIDFDHLIAARRIAHFCAKSPEEIFGLFFSSPVTALFEQGKLSPQDFFKEVKDMLGLKISYETFVPIWNEIFFLSKKNRAVCSLACSLRQDYRIAVLTNINILHFEYLKKYFPIFGIFHHVFTSFELGFSKPNQEIYRRVLEILKVQPQKVYYTDDREELVASARTLGIKADLFIGLEQLKQGLSDAGIQVN